MGRLLDSLLALVEAGIERIADPERVRYLEEALRIADRRAAEFATEAGEAHDRLDRVLGEIGCALGVEGEPDQVLIDTAWEARGKLLRINDLETEVALLKERVYG